MQAGGVDGGAGCRQYYAGESWLVGLTVRLAATCIKQLLQADALARIHTAPACLEQPPAALLLTTHLGDPCMILFVSNR